MKGYWYREGYLRTSSSEYKLDDVDDLFVHLTNDAVQQKGNTFGKYEDCNKVQKSILQVSFAEFKDYLKKSGVQDGKF